MDFKSCIDKEHSILMEGALGERLKREYHLQFNDQVAMADLIYDAKGQSALASQWQEYIHIAGCHGLPFLATTPTRRANKERVVLAGYSSSIITDNVKFLRGMQQKSGIEMFVGVLMGAKGDAYTGKPALSQEEAQFNQNALVHSRFRGIQANTSPLSYTELDGSLDLKCSAPVPFAEEMMKLPRISSMNIFGGCCGTDGRHMEQVVRRLRA